MNYLKCAACILILWWVLASVRTDVHSTAPRSAQSPNSLNVEVNDSDAAIQIESKSDDQSFIERWSQSRPQNQESQAADSTGADHEDYFGKGELEHFK